MRRPLTRLAASVAATLAAGVLLAGCGGDDDGDAGGDPSDAPTTSATEPSTSDTTGPATEDTPSDDTDPGQTAPPTPLDPNTTAPTPVPTGAEEFCAAFSDAFDALAAAEFSDDDRDRLSPAVIDAIHQWGEDLEAAALPAEFDEGMRAGVAAMVRVLADVPDDATGRDLDDLEGDLSDSEEDQTEQVSDWASTHCNLS